ncbi:organoarsenical effux MFS transporter ArsJ [Hydrogenovibrio sp. 3SP14C1]|uniref:organoarsenical effux MFS transporter ArsJ n=1 Tax=Hydrogenovibrio sp. 3SP14C1 TaxID=3038774 RepID=UPI002415E13D|nr:organoarsenical effux MFS transporter ArsJ [Hydrogenovibrio sp. 3SP14C1]MDG4812637.1 organoarsenical effux MFS transporter ArsJ [Hydrogenovibrio sp. 3SP14C1]
MTLSPLQQYGLVTANYWAFTVTDGAIRMLVLLYFHQLGYSPLEIALLFVFYEFFGIVTNLFGGWLGARLGLNVTMNLGLGLQIIALMMLTVSPEWLTVAYVMAAQALSGIAKDLNKMSAKSSVKSLASEATGQLYRWVALLTGSKNALKGVGFFVGAALLGAVGFVNALYVLTALIVIPLIFSLLWLDGSIGKAKNKPKFREVFSKSSAINWLSGARFFLFGARDVWFVVALPVYLQAVLGWSHTAVGAFMASWIIGYGMVQAFAPALTGRGKGQANPTQQTAMKLALMLALVPVTIGLLLSFSPTFVVVFGLLVFGVVFALNSSVHSYLIVSYADADGTSKDVGFYYMANAAGRLIGTILSGWLYQVAGLEATLWVSSLFVILAALLVLKAKPVQTV